MENPYLIDVIRPTPSSGFPTTSEALFSAESLTPRPGFQMPAGAKIFTIGSCFARNIEEALHSVGYEIPMLRFAVPADEWPARPNGILNRYSTPSILQIIQWLCSSSESSNVNGISEQFWLETGDGIGVDLDLCGFAPVTHARFHERREEMFSVFSECLDADYIVITLGQTESWKLTSRALHWGAVPAVPSLRQYWATTQLCVDDSDSAFRGVAEVVRLIRRMNTGAKFIISISPVPATRYWYPEPALSAYWKSKLALWTAAQRLVDELPDMHYFPSFEAVHLAPDAWGADRIHVKDDVVRRIVQGLLNSCSFDARVPLNNEPGYFSNVPQAKDEVSAE